MFSVEIQIFKTYSHLFYWWATQNVNTDYSHTIESNYNVLYQNITSYISCLHTNLHTACARCYLVIVHGQYIHVPIYTLPATHDMPDVNYSSR